MPESPEFRIGGQQVKAFFVAPVSANYTFNTRFDGGGELWLSPSADPRQAERLVSIDYTSTTPEADMTATSSMEWTSSQSG